jgi:hypothetical protein
MSGVDEWMRTKLVVTAAEHLQPSATWCCRLPLRKPDLPPTGEAARGCFTLHVTQHMQGFAGSRDSGAQGHCHWQRVLHPQVGRDCSKSVCSHPQPGDVVLGGSLSGDARGG